MSLWRRAFRSPQTRRLLQLGVRHGLLAAVRAAMFASDKLDPYPRQLPLAIHPFDLAYGVDTSGFRHGEDLGFEQGAIASTRHEASLSSTIWTTAYYGIAPSVFDDALALTGVTQWEDFTFLDLGCGKGRALLLASRFPFRRILGIELDGGLAATAARNLQIFSAPWQRCRSLEVAQGDAAAMRFPEGPLILFLYNPFLAPVLRRALRRLEDSVRTEPREVWLLYVNPEAAQVLRTFSFLQPAARATFRLEPEDQLADRAHSTREEVALFRFDPRPR